MTEKSQQMIAAARHEVPVLDSTMSYVEAGTQGPTVLLLHGNPTSSYIWRNIIPRIAPVARCIAPDLIGYGQSGKPDIAYRFADQVRYLDAFIAALGLDRLVILAQDWGTALAFHHASRQPQSMLGLAFMEFIRPFADWESFHQRPQARELFKAFRTPGQGEKLILDDNIFIERILPGSVLRQMAPEELEAYRQPFPTPASRRPILSLPRDLPIAGEPADVFTISTADHAALRASTYPKLLFSGDPGALISPEQARESAAGLSHCRLVELSPGAHYLQEDHPIAIGDAVRDWLIEIGVAQAPDIRGQQAAAG
ncbi:Haloalkane dehalogenase [Bosea sp. 62]|uniref:haloalkane dehalogenase n=1 Tax=unclassified Bosea (in: a-proteobacteria) TaxID=2653178 RepID=UPI001259547F|nr:MULTISPECIES: haloalkane dehalogenase [unclassified Bosea (in: a-proteobacteria)]CAD5252474.1 Haloalkane dehalogenase [Bosea sp. 7B]CAD5278944.1 Haloalkane dehalogenase [Bosea sp. 21B]CAD5280055.1 Haloalkane dehalogenase [Bosea sp. 46]VVT59595.1 Haloalkane dehalogenase [Bosea sp. EC-HK365B]VXB35381.1 Haloalkane dehalogenase [Bosea sp. 62]